MSCRFLMCTLPTHGRTAAGSCSGTLMGIRSCWCATEPRKRTSGGASGTAMNPTEIAFWRAFPERSMIIFIGTALPGSAPVPLSFPIKKKTWALNSVLWISRLWKNISWIPFVPSTWIKIESCGLWRHRICRSICY